jgi:hypothetical protein
MSGSSAVSFSVRSVTPSRDDVAVTADPVPVEPDIVITATGVTDDGKAIYPREVIRFRSEAMKAGLTVEFDYPPEQRVYRQLNSAVVTLAVEFAVGLTANGAWALIEWLRGKGRGRKVTATVTRTKRHGLLDKTTETATFEGLAEDVADLVERWRDDA